MSDADYYEGDLNYVIEGLKNLNPNPAEQRFQAIYDDRHQKWPGKVHRYLLHPIIGWYIPCQGLEPFPNGYVVPFETPITCENPACKKKT